MSANYRKNGQTFRAYTTYNRADSRIQRTGDGSRIKVINGVEKRCNLVLAAFADSTTDTVAVYEILSYMQRMARRGETYTKGDVSTALKKCIDAGLIERVSWGKYVMRLNLRVLRIQFVEPANDRNRRAA